MVDQREVADLVDDRPDLADGLEAVIAADAETETWTFEDVPVETGVFGEIVAHDVVESVDDGYRVADPDAVRSVLEGDAESTESNSDSSADPLHLLRSYARGRTARNALVALGLTALFVIARVIPYSDVFRDGGVTLAANDPYHYRYWVDQLLARSTNPLDLGTLLDLSIGEMTTGEPLFVATLWWVSALLGGSHEVVGLVLAWYPIVGALLVGALVYVVGAHLLGDRRVGVLAAGILAVMPAHAMRTSVGFGDHHAFDYVWLMAVIATLVWVVSIDESFGETARRGAVAFGVAVAGLTLAWEGSPLMLLPVALYLAVTVLLDVDDGESPLRTNAPVLAGLALASVLTMGAYLGLAWGSLSVAVTPFVLFVGGIAVAGGSELLARRGFSVEEIAIVEVAVPVAAVVLLAVAAGDILSELIRGFGFVFATSGIGETASAYALDQSLGLQLFGGAVVFALPTLVWALRPALLGDRRWLALSVFTWFFLALSVLQLRFMGQLAPLVSLFAALGLLWAFARLGLTTTPVPIRAASDLSADHASGQGTDTEPWLDRSALTVRSGVAALVLLAAVVGPGAYFLPEKVSGSTVSDTDHETAQWMATYAADQDWTYPENYVFSDWGGNRAFNYPVSGVAANYSYAQENFSYFISASDPDPWYDRLRNRTGFVVLEPLPPRDNTVQQHLYNTYGSRWVTPNGSTRYEAVSHFRAVYETEDGQNKVFTLVPGARVAGAAPSNTTVDLQTTVDIPNDEFTYRKTIAVNRTGQYQARAPYPGTYDVQVGNQTHTLTVPESAVENGTRITVDG